VRIGSAVIIVHIQGQVSTKCDDDFFTDVIIRLHFSWLVLNYDQMYFARIVRRMTNDYPSVGK